MNSSSKPEIGVFQECGLHVLAAFLGVFIAVLIASNGRSFRFATGPALVAGIACLWVILPSVFFRNLVLHKGIRHLGAIAWRMPTALFSVLISRWYAGEQRNCFLLALVTCYFITLTLESWLQIRQAKLDG